jgi:LAO/AO transport system kinase
MWCPRPTPGRERVSETSEQVVARLVAGLSRGNRAAISEALNLVDDRRPAQREMALELLDRLEHRSGHEEAHRVGVTGAPGAGKSSLLNALVDELRKQSRNIGVIAVDPSSQRTGGALLGDRMRIGASARAQGVFLRSMAARDRLGGLADATHASAAILSAVFDVVFIETVGVGQSECDVAQLVDTLVFVAQPGAGDVLQFMKAGILELPDIFAVNKSDIGAEAERTASELGSGLDLSETTGRGRWQAPVLLTSARDREGIGELMGMIDRHRVDIAASGELARRRDAGRLAFVRESLMRRYGEFGLDRIGGIAALERSLAEARDRSAFRLVLEMGREIEDGLAKPD